MPPSGFASVEMQPTREASGLAEVPAGTFWYRLADSSFEWFVRAEHLTSGRAYRVEIVVDNANRYSIASDRADSTGTLASHGALLTFANRVCVGNDATPGEPLDAAHRIDVALKADGSPTSGAQGVSSLTSPGSALPCSGNGDNQWDYMLMGQQPITLAHGTPEP